MYNYRINLSYHGSVYNSLILRHEKKLTSQEIKEMLIAIKNCIGEEKYDINKYKDILIEAFDFEEIDILNVHFSLSN